MIPPSWVVEACEKHMSNCRIGWMGFDKEKSEDTLNKGTFALIELRRQREQDERLSAIGVPWGSRGPVYGSAYDPLSYVPIYIINVDKTDVYSGKVIDLVKRWSTPIGPRLAQQREDNWNEYNDAVTEIAGQQADYLVSESNRATHGGNITANKHLTAEEKSIISGEDAAIRKEEAKADMLATPADGISFT